MARGSRVNIDLDLEQLPVFGVVPECIRQDVYGGAVDRNQAFAMHAVAPGAEVPEALLPILYDAQTSGGLLIALPEGQAQRFQAMMQERGLEVCPIIGKVTALEPGMNEGLIRVHGKAFRNLIGLAAGLLSQEEARPSDTVPEASAEPPAAHLDEACCCGSFEWESPPSPASIAEKPAPELEESTSSSPMETLKSFQAFMKAANEPGLIDARNKKLMAVCLSIAHHCEPCLKAHLESALEMGLSREELDEAANLAIAFGGCTSMMFYRETLMKILAQTPR
jgi:AhpD family alkylhydroperoxidase